jgi:hypothetical protein
MKMWSCATCELQHFLFFWVNGELLRTANVTCIIDARSRVLTGWVSSCDFHLLDDLTASPRNPSSVNISSRHTFRIFLLLSFTA